LFWSINIKQEFCAVAEDRARNACPAGSFCEKIGKDDSAARTALCKQSGLRTDEYAAFEAIALDHAAQEQA
jgi:hypothetical protein